MKLGDFFFFSVSDNGRAIIAVNVVDELVGDDVIDRHRRRQDLPIDKELDQAAPIGIDQRSMPVADGR